MFPQKLATRLRDQLVQSRFVTISLTLHAILLLILAMVVVIKPLAPPESITSAGPLVQPAQETPQGPRDPIAKIPTSEAFTPPSTGGSYQRIIEGSSQRTIVSIDGPIVRLPEPGMLPKIPGEGNFRPEVSHKITSGLTKAELTEIGKFTDHVVGDRSTSKPEYEFTAYLGRYGGNWNSTVRQKDGKITAGSLPNLLYVTSKWTKDRIKTNERNVEAIPLDSDEIFTTRPPFILLTGTRDFVLTDKEVENVRKYIRLGGAIWGDGSVPGKRSDFDIAFEREMKRVLGENNDFEALPEDHPVLAKGYFPKVKSLPSGINHYQEAVRVMRWGGEIAVIQTRNDYGDMWQIGLDKDAKIDLSRDEHGQYVAMNENLWSNRGTYVRNVDQPAVEQAYKFGINMIFHLITRWESRTANSAPL